MQVLATTAGLASINKSRLTVLLVDAKPSTEEGTSWIEAASWYPYNSFGMLGHCLI